MPGLRRLVRTVSTDLGKNVAFGVVNEVGTLDRDDYARCQIILEHMVRNALDHGIEAPQDRLNAGKPVKGLISVDVRRAGANSLITLSDDGRGIDPQAMRENARRKGLDVDVDTLSDEEALRRVLVGSLREPGQGLLGRDRLTLADERFELQQSGEPPAGVAARNHFLGDRAGLPSLFHPRNARSDEQVLKLAGFGFHP